MHIPSSDLHTYTPGQDEIEQSPCVTFAQFRNVATREGWDEAFLVKHCAGEVEPDAIRRILHGAHVPAHDGEKSHHASMNAVVLTYSPLLDLYFTHLCRPVPPPIRSKIRSMYANGYDLHRLSCYLPAWADQIPRLTADIMPTRERRCKCGCGKKPAARSQYADPGCRVRVARRKKTARTPSTPSVE